MSVRIRLLPWAALALPALLGVGALGLLGSSALGFDPLWPADDFNLAEHVATRNLAAVIDLTRRGHDINGVHEVEGGLLKTRAVRVTPLEAAVATREEAVVRLVLEQGAQVTSQNHARLACFARVVGAPANIEQLFLKEGPVDCTGVATPWKKD